MRKANGRTAQIFSSIQQRLKTNVDVFVGGFFDFDHAWHATAAYYHAHTDTIYIEECVEAALSDDELRALAAHELDHSVRQKSKWRMFGRPLRPVLWWLSKMDNKARWKMYAKEEKDPQRAGIRETDYETYVSSLTKSMQCLVIERIKRLAQA